MVNWKIIDRQQINKIPIELLDVVEGKIDGIIINNVLPKALLKTCVDNIKNKFKIIENHHGYGELEEDIHLGSKNGFDNYIQQAKQQEIVLKKIGGTLKELFATILQQLTHATLKRPSYRGIPYKSSVVKVWGMNQELLPHFDSYAGATSQGIYLKEIGQIKKMMSFVLMLQAPNEGGMLHIYNLERQATPPVFQQLRSKRQQQFIKVYLEKNNLLKYTIPPVANSLVIFSGGERWHSVTPIKGAVQRITIGGFLMPSKANDIIYYWS